MRVPQRHRGVPQRHSWVCRRGTNACAAEAQRGAAEAQRGARPEAQRGARPEAQSGARPEGCLARGVPGQMGAWPDGCAAGGGPGQRGARPDGCPTRGVPGQRGRPGQRGARPEGCPAVDGSSSRTVDGQCQERFGPGPRTRASAKNVGQCQERGTVPTIVGARMIGAFRPLQILSSYSHCHKVQRCLKYNIFDTAYYTPDNESIVKRSMMTVLDATVASPQWVLTGCSLRGVSADAGPAS
jgi:hypothetical protein